MSEEVISTIFTNMRRRQVAAKVDEKMMKFLDRNIELFGIDHRIDPHTGNLVPTGELMLHRLHGYEEGIYTYISLATLIVWYRRIVFGTGRMIVNEDLRDLGMGELGDDLESTTIVAVITDRTNIAPGIDQHNADVDTYHIEICYNRFMSNVGYVKGE